MACPFHHDVRRDAQGQGGDDESATSGVGADEFPLGMDFVGSDISLVFLQNCLCNVVKLDGYTVCRLDCGYFNMVTFNVAFAQIIGV